jgi:hypothetical protein
MEVCKRELVQNTTGNNLSSRTKRRVGQMQQDERKRRLKKGKEDDSDYEDSSVDTSAAQDMDETTE